MKVDELKKLLKSVVVKRNQYAESFETARTLANYDSYCSAKFEEDTILSYTNKLTYEILASYSIPDDAIKQIISSPMTIYGLVDEKKINRMMSDFRLERTKSYVEENNYYRMLAGLPNFGDPGDKLPIHIEGIEDNKLIHTLTAAEVELIVQKDLLGTIQSYYPDKEYISYIDKRLDPICRRADIFSLLYIDPSISSLLYDRFKNNYEKFRRYFMRVEFNQLYYDTNEFYEDSMILYIVAATTITTMNDMLVDILDFELTDEDVMDNIFLSAGFKGFKQMPKMYKIKLMEKFALLLTQTGSKDAIVNLSDLFDINFIYRYILRKRRKDGDWDVNTPLSQRYDLSFVRIPYEVVNVHDFLKTHTDTEIPYDEFVRNDSKWGIGADKLRDKVLETSFSYLETKYISIENMIDIARITAEISMFFHYVFINKEKIQNIMVFHKGSKHFVRLFDLIVYQLALVCARNKFGDDIPDTQEGWLYVIGMNTNQPFTDIKHYFKVEYSGTDKEEILEGLRELEDNASKETFLDVYGKNYAIINKVKDLMLYENDYYKYSICSRFINAATYTRVVPEVFLGCTTYTDYVKKYTDLYTRYVAMTSSTNLLKEEITTVNSSLISFADSLNETIHPGYTESFFYIDESEFDVIKQFLDKVIDFFRSYTTDLREFDTIFRINDVSERLSISEDIAVSEGIDIFENVYNPPGEKLGEDITITQINPEYIDSKFSIHEVLYIFEKGEYKAIDGTINYKEVNNER